MQTARAEMLFLLFIMFQWLGVEATGGFYPNNCAPSACPAFVTWTPDLKNGAVLFHLESTTTGWVAVGLSDDQQMGTAGIDDVLSCQLSTDNNNTVYAKDMWNPKDQIDKRQNQINDNQYAIKMFNYSYIDGRLRCNFTRLIITNNTNQDRHLNDKWFILLAHGHERGTPDSHFTIYHGHLNRFFSADRVNVSSSQGAMSACGVALLEQVHGICMFISFGILVPLAIFFAAYMKKPLAKHGAWFQVHRILMLLAILFTIVGFIVIFVSRNGFMSPLGPSNPTGTAHMVIGFVLVTLQFLNPIIGFLRPKPDSLLRPIFYVIHAFLIGYVLEVLGAVNISLGLSVFAELMGESEIQSWAFWVWIALLVVYGVVETVAFVHRVVSLKKKEEDEKKSLLLQKTKEFPEVPIFQWTLFTAAVITLTFFGGSVITLIATACSPKI